MASLFSYVICSIGVLSAWTQAYPFKGGHSSHSLRHKPQLKHLQESLLVPRQWKRFHQDKGFENEVLKTEGIAAYPIGCLHMETFEGDYIYTSDGSDIVCGMYVIGEPDTLVQIEVLSLNAECKDGAIISFVDGWELQGEYFPSDDDHVLSPAVRFAERCGGKVPKKFLAHQNAAVIQFKLPKRGQGFTVRVTFQKNTQPCNVISMYPSGVYTLRNYGRKINCSVAVIYPVNVNILGMDVDQTTKTGEVSIVETGPKTECDDKDYVEILDGPGLSTTFMRSVLPPLCGLSSVPIPGNFTLGCQNSVVRLSSSGAYYNSVTVDFSAIDEVQPSDCKERK